MKRLLILLSLFISTSVFAYDPPLLSDLPDSAFKHIKLKKHYTVDIIYPKWNPLIKDLARIPIQKAMSAYNKATNDNSFMTWYTPNNEKSADIYIHFLPLNVFQLIGELAVPNDNSICWVSVAEFDNPGIYDPWLYAHEFGHCFSLAHDDDGKCSLVMLPFIADHKGCEFKIDSGVSKWLNKKRKEL